MTTAFKPVAYQRPKLYAKQAAFLFTPARYSLTEASTKSGKTIGCIVWLFEQAAVHGGPGKNYWWVAPTFPVAEPRRQLDHVLVRGGLHATAAAEAVRLPLSDHRALVVPCGPS